LSRRIVSGTMLTLLLIGMSCTILNVKPVTGWSNGSFSTDPQNPNYGTHDWIAQHALDWLPNEEREYIINNLAIYLYGTELPDNAGAPDGIGDTALHHIYYWSNESIQDDASAIRAQTEYVEALNYIQSGNITMAVKTLGIMSHYIVDVGVFGHVMGSGTDWSPEVHHSDYESYVQERTNSYDDEFNTYLAFDGSLNSISAYYAACMLAYDTTFDVDGELTCVWMDQNYDWNNQTFKDRCGESLNLAVNLLADVMHAFTEQQVVALVNGSRAYNYDLDLENIAFKYPAFRSSGSTGASETTNWIKDQFENFGLETWLEPFNFTTWNLSSQPSLVIDDDGNQGTTGDQTTINSFRSAHYSWPTPEGGTFADLVILPLPDADNRSDLATKSINMTEWNAIDATGKIVLVGYEVGWCQGGSQAYVDKISAQPPAAIIRTWWYDWMSFVPDFFSSGGGRPLGYPYYWNIGIPMGSVYYQDGLWIKNRESTMDVSTSFSIESVIDTGNHYNVVGKISGYKNPEKLVIISGHYDTIMSGGFCDNGAGTAGVIELAKVFTDAVKEGFYKPKYTLLFIAIAGEELGLVGSINYIKQHKNEMADIIAVINLDCIGSDELYVTETDPTNGFDLDELILEAADDLGITATLEEPGGSDQEAFRSPSWAEDIYYWYWGLEADIADATPVNSSALLISYPLIYYNEWDIGAPGWIHTSYDNSTSTTTLDWVEEEDLENHIKVAALTIIRVSPTSPVQIIQTTVTIEGEDYPITVESNVIITNVTATRNTLNFTSSGLTGEEAYINATIPIGLNKTEIKVSIDNTELIPPPYPIITTNGTHYFIYFEFTLSTHNITIQYAIADIATTNVTLAKTIVGQGYTVRINATIQNQGHYEETFNVTVYANTTEIGKQPVALSSGNITAVSFVWNTTGFAKGNYTISAYAWSVSGEIDILDNTKAADSTVLVTVVGDVNGDHVVDIDDLILIIYYWGTYEGGPNWNGNMELSNDTVIDIDDLLTLIYNWGSHW